MEYTRKLGKEVVEYQGDAFDYATVKKLYGVAISAVRRTLLKNNRYSMKHLKSLI